MRKSHSLALMAASLIFWQASSIPVLAEKLPRYKRTYSVKLNFGHPIQIPFVLDSGDADGDGFDDFAVSAKIVPPRNSDVLKAPKIYSFLVQNLPKTGKLRPYNLGENSLTHQTHTGAFVRSRGASYFVLGRNGETLQEAYSQ